jgi:general secretion pathway protein A
MNDNYRAFFGFTKEPFTNALRLDEILKTEELIGVKNRFDYALRIGGIAVVTGEIGAGKSTALRYASEQLHPSAHKSFYVTATTGSPLELYRQIGAEMGIGRSSNSKALMIRLIKNEVQELACGKKVNVVLTIDEASLLRLEVFVELHTIAQFDKDSKPYLPIILAGQANLIDKLSYRTSAPLASRVIAKSHLQGLGREAMQQYLSHHLKVAGVSTNLFDDTAVSAIHQGSGGLLRQANHLARGALIAAAKLNITSVSAEHVRLASTELLDVNRR